MFQYQSVFSGYSVDDIAIARSFYKNVLNFKVVDNPMGLIELHFNDGMHIILYGKDNHTPATFTVLNIMVKDIEVAVDELIEQGVKFEQYDDDIATDSKGICRNDYGPTLAWFKDPAGNILSLIEDKNA